MKLFEQLCFYYVKRTSNEEGEEMEKLIILSIVGFIAQLIDGALGMAYGLTSSTLLLAAGAAPAIVSATVHMSEVVTTAVSGISHYKFGNVDKKLLFRLTIPGAIGAFIGACFLSNISGEVAKPYISTFLFLLGFYIIFRFLFRSQEKTKRVVSLSSKQSISLGLFAGFADATGGGGWGPISTPILLSKDGMAPHKVIGTVDTSEFAVAVSATLGFILSLGWETVNFLWVIALILGGVIAAPIAAWLVRIVPGQLLGLIVGGVIILINARTILTTWISNENIHLYIYLFLLISWILIFIYGIRKMKLAKKHMVHFQESNLDEEEAVNKP